AWRACAGGPTRMTCRTSGRWATGRTRRSCWEAFERAGNGFRRWSEQVEHAGYCCRPIRIRGKVDQVDRATGEVRGVYSTEGEPDDVLLVACGSRRAARCRSCASWYRRDAFHLVAAGLRGGKG